MSSAEQVTRLREHIERANNAYYVPSLRSGQALDAQGISDAEALEAAHPQQHGSLAHDCILTSTASQQ